MRALPVGRVTPQANQSAEAVAFGVSNVVVFLLLALLASIAYRAYRREEATSFLVASAGFSFLAFGSVTEAVYEFGVNGGYQAFGRELYLLRTAEATLLAVGVGLLLASLYRLES